jgi:hypothetical protein
MQVTIRSGMNLVQFRELTVRSHAYDFAVPLSNV